MKKSVPVLLIVLFAAAAALFCGLWLRERSDRDDVRRLAQSGASEAYESFLDYASSGDDGDYWRGVAAFRSFEQAYQMLAEGTNREANYIFCNEVYAALLLSPDKSREHIPELCQVMELLSKDVEDVTGYGRMAELRNTLAG